MPTREKGSGICAGRASLIKAGRYLKYFASAACRGPVDCASHSGQRCMVGVSGRKIISQQLRCVAVVYSLLNDTETDQNQLNQCLNLGKMAGHPKQ